VLVETVARTAGEIAIAEVAEIISIPENTVKQACFYAREVCRSACAGLDRQSDELRRAR